MDFFGSIESDTMFYNSVVYRYMLYIYNYKVVVYIFDYIMAFNFS